MNTSDLIRKLCKEHCISIAELARKIGQSPQNFGKKLKRNTVSESELKQIADALGVIYEQTFVSDCNSKMNMLSDDNTLAKRYITDELGMTIQSSDASSEDLGSSYIELDSAAFAKINSLLHNMPHYVAELHARQMASDTYKVIFDKGLGQLQRSAKNKDRFRANIVAFGTNNDITGQAELEKFQLKISTPALAVFDIAAIATNQYYLARIDRKLLSMDNKLDYVQKFLEKSKKSDLWANSQFLQNVSHKIYEITLDEQYRLATLTTVQSIRITALSNVNFYHKMMRDSVKTDLNNEMTDSAAKDKLDHFYQLFDAYLYSIYVYGFAYVIEVVLSQITDEFFLRKVKDEIQRVIKNFHNDYSKELKQFIDTSKSLNQGGFSKALSNLKPKARLQRHTEFDLVFNVLALAANFAANYDKGKKETQKNEVMEQYHIFQDRLKRGFQDLASSINAIELLTEVYNQPVELLITENKAFLKVDTTKPDSASESNVSDKTHKK